MISGYQFLTKRKPWYRKFTEHTELITALKENDRRQKTNTMFGREKDRREKNLKLPIVVRTFQTIYEKEIHCGYWTSNQRKLPKPNGIQKKKRYKKIFLGFGARSNTPNNTMQISNRTEEN